MSQTPGQTPRPAPWLGDDAPDFDELTRGLELRSTGELPTHVAAVIRDYLDDNELEWQQSRPGSFSFALPGERKLQTAIRLDVGAHALGIHAFVCRQPDENHVGVYRWLLQRNLKAYAAAFAIDAAGDIYLDGRLPLGAVDPIELDRLLGAVLSMADESFNTLLELGFATSIRKEWDWRRLRGESTRNLDAFRGWLEAGDAAADRGRVPPDAP